MGRVAQTLDASQYPEQQSESNPQPVPFPVHGSAQTFEALHVPEQQAPPPVGQVRPFAVQPPGCWQVAGVPEQTPVQHSPPPPQEVPFDLHGSAHWFEPLQ
jgi:hypothetical protein